MRNFIRSLRFAGAYRTRIILSIVCAAMVAVFWAANLTSVGAVLSLLQDKRTFQEQIRDRVKELKAEIDKPTETRPVGLRTHADSLTREIAALQADPTTPDRDNTLRRKHRELAETQGKLQDINEKIYWRELLQMQVLRFLPEDRFNTFVWIMVAVTVGVAIKGVFDFGQEMFVGSVVNRTLFDLRNRLFRSAIHHDTRQISDAGTAELMARLTNDVEQLGQGMKTVLGRVIVEPLKAIACLVTACMISWQLTIVFSILVPLALFTLTKLSRMMRRAARKVLERMSEMYQIVRESFDGIRVVKAYTMEPYERRRFRKASAEYTRRAQQVANIDAFAGPTIELFGVMALGLALTAGAYIVIEGERRIGPFNMRGEDPLSFSALITLYAMLVAVADPIRKLSSVYTKIQAGGVAADRIFAVLDKSPTVTNNSENPVLPRHSESIEFRNLTFSYTLGTETPTLNGINLTVKAGETVALVGPNGCGKSTLLGFLPRFYDPDHGSILIDGVNIRTVNLRSLRKQVGLVTQQTIMFEDTLFNNIAYGKPGATAAEVEAVARQAFAHEFIEVLPNGYQTVVGHGWKPSGGQEQRIALARAILRNPSILILDEFTSQIDPESETKIHLTLREFVKGRTTFLITHRRSTLEIADRIVVMDGGQIVAVGTHAVLMSTCPLYQRLWESPTIVRGEAA